MTSLSRVALVCTSLFLVTTAQAAALDGFYGTVGMDILKPRFSSSDNLDNGDNDHSIKVAPRMTLGYSTTLGVGPAVAIEGFYEHLVNKRPHYGANLLAGYYTSPLTVPYLKLSYEQQKMRWENDRSIQTTLPGYGFGIGFRHRFVEHMFAGLEGSYIKYHERSKSGDNGNNYNFRASSISFLMYIGYRF